MAALARSSGAIRERQLRRSTIGSVPDPSRASLGMLLCTDRTTGTTFGTTFGWSTVGGRPGRALPQRGHGADRTGTVGMSLCSTADGENGISDEVHAKSIALVFCVVILPLTSLDANYSPWTALEAIPRL